MLLYLIRHGQTNHNKAKRLQGQTDIPLNEFGIEAAEKTAKGMADIDFDLIISSPLNRAITTAKIIKGHRDIPIEVDERIKEISFGDYEGLCSHGIDYDIPDLDFPNFFDAPEKYNTPPNGESFKDVISRCGNFIKDIMANKDYEDKTILISTHGCALKAILYNLRETELKDFWGDGVSKNCGVTIVKVDGNKVEILEEGKTYY